MRGEWIGSTLVPMTMTETSRVGAPTLTVASVARRLGVSPTTLRTWDRRHGLGPSEHAAGTHRRYTAQDVARLELMRRLTTEGASAGDAARIALQTDPDDLPEVALDAPAAVPLGRGASLLPAATDPEKVRDLVRAADALDSAAFTAIVRESMERRGVVATWDTLVVPALAAIGARWARTGQGVDSEHLASECVLGVLRHQVARFSTSTINARPILLACAEEEQHSLPVHAVAAALAERHVAARVLGARVPSDALAAAVRRLSPSAVLIWAQRPHTGDPGQVRRLPDLRPAPLVVVAGPGWPAHPERWGLRQHVVGVADLSEAVALLGRAAGA
jgi:DNA-binding transcriptional MerR regulator